MDNITVNMENLSEEERASLVALIEKANKPQSKVWKPKEGDAYFFVWSDGTVIGDCFRTKEEAEEKVKELKVKAKWKRLSIE